MRTLSDKHIQQLANAKNVAVLTGAGISAESGIPTFRGKEGLWKNHDPMKLASPEAFSQNPELVWEWYEYRKNIIKKSEPNSGHLILAEMEKYFHSFALCTQNVDGLHNRAGSVNIFELHGNIFESKCNNCSLKYKNIEYRPSENLPKCNCGALLRPNVVWFGETLPEKELEASFNAAHHADVFMLIGTSSVVYPAAMLPQEAKHNGALVIEINIEKTALTNFSDISITGKASEILKQVWDSINI